MEIIYKGTGWETNFHVINVTYFFVNVVNLCLSALLHTHFLPEL